MASVYIDKKSCNEYWLVNGDVSSKNYTVRKLNDEKTFEDIETGTVLPGEYNTYQFGNDGVYEVEYNATKYTVLIYCDVKDAILALMKKINCKCDDCLNDYGVSKALYYFNAMSMEFYTFLVSINKQYVDNWLYSSLDPQDLEDLYCISEMIDRMTELATCADELDKLCDCD